MPYDRDSGQVFKETVLPRNALARRDAGDNRDRDWSRQMLRPLIKPRSFRGPRSLVSMSIHVVAENINQVTEQHLLALPPELMWRVWNFLEVRYVFAALPCVLYCVNLPKLTKRQMSKEE